MSVLNYHLYNMVKGIEPKWLNSFNRVTEGIKFIESEDSNEIQIDFNNDSEDDIVKLENPIETRISRFDKVPTFAGYSLEKNPKSASFIEYIKSWESISDTELRALIDHTYPNELKKINVRVLFVTGSSSPMSARIAEALKEMYYKKARIVDVMKAYYGADIKDIIDWDKYEGSDPKTKKMIDSFLRSGSKDFKGYIKKSGGLQSGARKILKPGHTIDDYIITSISDEYSKWMEMVKDRSIDQRVKLTNRPHFMLVDEFVIQGSTVLGIFRQLSDSLNKAAKEQRIDRSTLEFLKFSLHGYVMFTQGSRFKS